MHAFDPYYTWLGISPDNRPIDHYQLLGIRKFETDPTVISNAADRQMSFVRQFAGGERRQDSQRLLNELSSARVTLLNPQRKAAYDAALIQASHGSAPAVVRQVAPVAIPQAQPAAVAPTPSAENVLDYESYTPRRKRSHSRGVPMEYLAFGAVFAAATGVIGFAYVRSLQPPPAVADASSIEVDRPRPAASRPSPPKATPVPAPTAPSREDAVAPAQPTRPVQPAPRVVTAPPTPEPQQPRQLLVPGVGPPMTQPAPASAPTQATQMLPAQDPREVLQNRSWSFTAPGFGTFSRNDFQPPAKLIESFSGKQPVFPWKDKARDLSGLFNYRTEDKGKVALLEGVGVTFYPLDRLRSYTTYKAGDRDGKLVVLEENDAKPFLLCNYDDDKLYGAVVFCDSGLPVIVQNRKAGSIASEYLVKLEGFDLVATPKAPLEGDDLEAYNRHAQRLDVTLQNLDQEHKERRVALKKYVKEQIDKERAIAARKLSAEKTKAISERNAERDREETRAREQAEQAIMRSMGAGS